MPGTPQRVDDFSLTCAPDVTAISEVRHGFTAWLRRWVADAEAIDELAVVLSELLTNAVSAAADRGGTVHVLACADDGDVVVAVRNPQVRWVEVDDRWDLADPLRAGGRGLLIVRTLVDLLEVEHDERAGTTTVRSRKSVPVVA